MSIWQGLGAFIYTGSNLSIDQIQKFKNCGGSWGCLLIHNDDVVAEENKRMLPGINAMFNARGMQLWGWFNGRGDNPVVEAKLIASITSNLGLPGIILDLEAEYQYPEGNADLMPILVSELRKWLPKKEIGVSTNGMNNSMIWNGRILDPRKSFYDLGIRVLPQWYQSYYEADGKTPQFQMRWLEDNGGKDFNFKDPDAKKTKYRGLPLSYVHPTLESTGVENAHLASELHDLKECKAFGFTQGFSLYTLERTQEQDFDLCQSVRNVLYL